MAPTSSGHQLPPKELALFKRILKCYEHKQYRNGLKFAKLILSNPKFADHGETLAMKGLILNCLGKKDEATEYVKRGLTNDVKSHVCWHVYGLMQRSEKKYDVAIKAYRNALKIEKDNIQVLRDLSLLQLQMRDLDGYKETRYHLFTLRPAQRFSWIGFALGLHLLEEYDMALEILEEFRKSQTRIGPYDFEHSEFLLYQNSVYREAGRLDEALEHLEMFGWQICDPTVCLEIRAELLFKLGRRQESAVVYRQLLAKNCENVAYFKCLERCMGLEDVMSSQQLAERLALYDELAALYPKSLAACRLPLAFMPESVFVPRVGVLLKNMSRKGTAPVFALLQFLYDDPVKVKLLEDLALSYCDSLERHCCFPDEEYAEAPSTLLWVYYYLALHYDYLSQFDKALTYVDKGLQHTPTVIELYLVKGRIYKHAGNRKEAVRWVEEAQSLDTADRYVNSKCAKYMLRAGMIGEAFLMCSRFTREGLSPADSMNEMQCMWIETSCADAFRRMGKYGEALKKCHEVDRHFSDIIEDQYDFHTYCSKRMTLCAYVRLLRLEDFLRRHDFFFKAARCAIKIYLRLYDHPEEVGGDLDGYGQNDVSSRELRKQFRKQKKKAVKAEMQRQQRMSKPPPPPTVDGGGGDELPKEVLNPVELAKTDKPLEDALIFLNPLIQLRSDKLKTYILGFEVHHRRDKVLLMLLCLQRAEQIDAHCAAVHLCKIKFFKYFQDNNIDSLTRELILEAYPCLATNSLDLWHSNAVYLETNATSVPHRLAAAEAMYHLDPSRKADAVQVAVELQTTFKGLTWKNCHRVLKSLTRGALSPVAEETVAAYAYSCSELFPMCTVFQSRLAAATSATLNHVNNNGNGNKDATLSPDEDEFSTKLTL